MTIANADYPLDHIVLPMGGQLVEDSEKLEALWIDDNFIGEEWFNGNRCFSIGGRFFGHMLSAMDKHPKEMTGTLPHLAELLAQYPLLILDGETYKSHDVYATACRPECTSINESQHGTCNLSFMAYDILRDLDGNWVIDKTWKERRTLLEDALAQIAVYNADNKAIKFVRLSLIYHGEQKKAAYKRILARGGQGMVLKDGNGKYFPGKKFPNNWIYIPSETRYWDENLV